MKTTKRESLRAATNAALAAYDTARSAGQTRQEAIELWNVYVTAKSAEDCYCAAHPVARKSARIGRVSRAW